MECYAAWIGDAAFVADFTGCDGARGVALAYGNFERGPFVENAHVVGSAV